MEPQSTRTLIPVVQTCSQAPRAMHRHPAHDHIGDPHLGARLILPRHPQKISTPRRPSVAPSETSRCAMVGFGVCTTFCISRVR